MPPSYRTPQLLALAPQERHNILCSVARNDASATRIPAVASTSPAAMPGAGGDERRGYA